MKGKKEDSLSQERKHIARKAAAARWSDPKKTIADRSIISAFCKKHFIQELYAFGSILREDFNRKSDVDLMYVAKMSLGYTGYIEASEELETIFGRNIDFVNKRILEKSTNRFRRDEILKSAQVIYAEQT